MKANLSHLPLAKQEEILAITEIIKSVVAPEKIILFGSYAKGGYREHEYISGDGTRHEYVSDYDFLVVTSRNSEKTTEQESTVMDRVDRYKPPVNLEIHGIDYINEGLRWGQYFFVDIINEGIQLYDSGSTHFVEPRVLTQLEEREKAQRYFDIWHPQSNEFIIDSSNALARGSLYNGAFYLHQATESLYYAILLVFTGYKPKTHNLWKLRKKTKAYSDELFLVFLAEDDKNEEHLFDLLKRGYIEARYKQNDYVITSKELEILIERVKRMNSIVQSICKQKIESLK
jgi:predicted nucleotidyltransferase/HEPN domain-containing protein